MSGDTSLPGDMYFGLLGPLAVRRGEAAVPVPPGQQRALAGLARCARAAGHLLAAESGLYQARDVLARIGAPEAAGITAELAGLAALTAANEAASQQ